MLPTVKYQRTEKYWLATWDKRGGGGVIAEGKTKAEALARFAEALAIWKREFTPKAKKRQAKRKKRATSR